MAKKGLASALSQAVSTGKQTLDEGQKAGLSGDLLRNAVRQAASQQMLAPTQNISDYIANLVASQQAAQQQQQASQPAQTVAPGAAPESNNGFAVNEDEESFTSKDDEKKEKKRSPWHERMDEMLGTNGLGSNLMGLAGSLNPVSFDGEQALGYLGNMADVPSLVKGTANEALSAGLAPLDILVPEWSFNPASKEEIAEGYAQGPAEFNGDFSMPSGETVANMTPEQREELAGLMGEGLGLSAASAMQFLPIGGLVPKAKPEQVLRSGGMPVDPKNLLQSTKSQVRQAGKTKGYLDRMNQYKEPAGPSEEIYREALERQGRVRDLLSGESAPAIEEAAANEAIQRAEDAASNRFTQSVMDRALGKIEKNTGKNKGEPLTETFKSQKPNERFQKLPEEAKSQIEKALVNAERKNGSNQTMNDVARAVNYANFAARHPMLLSSRGPVAVGGSLAGIGTLGGILGAETMGAFDGSGVPANMINNPEVASDISGSTNAIGTTAPSDKTDSDKGEGLAGLIGSATPSTHPQTQYSELLDWALNTDEGQAFMAAYPQYFDADLGYATVDDYLNGSGVGYGRLFSTPDEAAFSWLLGSDGSHAGIDSWRRRYAAQGLDTNDIDAVMDYIYGDNSVSLTDLNDPRMMYGNLGDDALANAAILRYLYQNNQFGLNQQWADSYLQSNGYAPGAFDANDFAWYMTLANMAQNNGAGYSANDIETLARLAGEGYQFGLVDDTNGFRDESETRRNARKYSLADLMSPNGNLNPYQDILYDSDMLDTALYFYNQSHPGQKLGIKER